MRFLQDLTGFWKLLSGTCRSLRMREAVENLIGVHRYYGRDYVKEVLRAIIPKNFPGRFRLNTALRRLQGKQAFWHSGLFHKELRSREGSRLTVRGRTMLDRDLKVLLLQNNVPRWVHMCDNIGMANSVLSRSPFLDYRLVEFAFSLDNNLKIRKGVTKYILREAKRDQLPPSIVNASQKIQYSGPELQWLNGPLRGFAHSLRDSKNSKLSEFLRTDILTPIIDDFYQSKRQNINPLCIWRILNSECWLRAYF